MTGTKKNSPPLQGEAHKLILEYGYRQPTKLQKRLIPFILRGRDLYAETGIQRGKSLTIAVSLLLRLKKGHKGIKSLVITESGEAAAKLVKCIKRLGQMRSKNLSVLMVGFSDLIKKEGRQLHSNPDIIVGTSARIIDHIRRGHVDLSHVELVFADEPGNTQEEFLNDIFFIFSKLPSHIQAVYFSHLNKNKDNNLLRQLKRPVVLQVTDFSGQAQVITHKYMITKQKNEALKSLIVAAQLEGVLVICNTAALGKTIEKELNAIKLKSVYLAAPIQQIKLGKQVEAFNTGKISVLIVTLSDMKAVNAEGTSYVIFYDLPHSAKDYQEYTKPGIIGVNCREIVNIISEDQTAEITTIEETCHMKMKEQELPKENEVIKGYFAQIVKKIKQEENPLELDYYKKLVKKNVSLFDRSYLMAYFVRNSLKKLQPKKTNKTTMFVSIGKSKGVYRQDLLKMFGTALNLKEYEIGEIKILENYSFIDIPQDYAAKAIEALNNSDFKGRKITVNYSRKKTERKPGGFRRARQSR